MTAYQSSLASILARWNHAEQAVDLVIGGRALIDIVDPTRSWGVSPFARRFPRRAVRQSLAEYRGVSADRDERHSESELEIAVCSACGDLGCGNLAVDVVFETDLVIWKQPHWAGDNDEEEEEADANDPASLLPQLLVFNRTAYDDALAAVEKYANRSGWYRGPESDAALPERLRNLFTPSWDR
ncbi:hypothetical protein CQ018_08410 [Arthrobacter sp. MYb227]|uniref:hypothetical protein n=1 Tax=Arthrobacter sp. MYb227 TaxID=1848601 RepID=UPI000CFD7C34|nr:hypothetical protein [Arthrobacter sp. MYb227]PQZ93673.1 hypothetical protein CQ018_08410 [Arthrobacter sp. MYb227]